MIKKLLLPFACLLFLVSCHEEAKITITNQVSGVKLDNISYCDIYLASNLLPGKSQTKTITGGGDIKFPLNGQVYFVMTKGEDQVLLKTKQSFFIDKDDHLAIIISDETEVIAPYD